MTSTMSGEPGRQASVSHLALGQADHPHLCLQQAKLTSAVLIAEARWEHPGLASSEGYIGNWGRLCTLGKATNICFGVFLLQDPEMLENLDYQWNTWTLSYQK